MPREFFVWEYPDGRFYQREPTPDGFVEKKVLMIPMALFAPTVMTAEYYEKYLPIPAEAKRMKVTCFTEAVK